jgi:hypothetical protein
MSLRRTLCVTRQPRCDGCLLQGSCTYARLFESPALRPEDQARSSAIPHPFVLEVEPGAAMDLAPGAPLGFGLTLIGSALQALPYLIHALGQAGERGIGKGQGRFELRGLDQELTLGAEDWAPVYRGDSGRYSPGAVRERRLPPAPERVQLSFHTPLRIKHHERLVGAAQLQAEILTRQLLWRLEALDRHYGEGSGTLGRDDFGADAAQVRLVTPRLRWHDWTRYSSRQDTLMQMGGLLGDLVLEGPGLPILWPALWLGQWTHLGKATSMGLGRYRVRCAASLPEPSEIGRAHV